MRARLRQEPFFAQAVGDADELLDRLVDLPGADVEIAERVGGVPVARLILDEAQILRDGRFELALAEQLLGVLECGGAIDGHWISQSYQTASAGGTIGGARPSSRSAQRRRGDRRSRSPCGGRSRSADRGRAARSICRSRVTLATIDAAAIAEQRRSPCSTPRCAIGRSGMRNASTSTMSGSGASASTARCIARSDA